MSSEGEGKPDGGGDQVPDNVMRPLFGKAAAAPAPAEKGAGGGNGTRPPTVEERAGKCPVVVLGHDNGFYFMLTPEGQLREVKGSRLDARTLRTVFGAEIQWLWDAFPKMREDQVVGWHDGAAGEFLVKRAHHTGLFNPERSVRGTGVWRGRSEDGKQSLIIHCGDRVLIDGEWHGAGIRHHGFIYPAFPAETPPAETPATVAEMNELCEFLHQWSWRTPQHAPRVLLGFIACGAVAGALRWRPHCQITGAQGTGKSWLDLLIKHLWGSLMLAVSAPTEFGIRAMLKGSARPVMVDEMEPDNMERARRVIELARLGSTDSQSPIVRGGMDGRAAQWPVRSCFLFSAILHPRFRPQDLSRICVLELDTLSIGERDDGELQQMWVMREIERLGKLGPALRRRMIDGFWRFEQNLLTYEEAMGGLGVKARVSAQIGTLLAAADTMLSDAPISAKHAAQYIGAFLTPDFTGHEDEEDHADCLSHLLSSPVYVEFDNGGRYLPMAEAIVQSKGVSGNRFDRALRQHGVGLITVKIGPEEKAPTFTYVAVANRHRGLDKIFEGTRWAEGGWRQALYRVKDAQRLEPISFGGFVQRAVGMPLASLPVGMED